MPYVQEKDRDARWYIWNRRFRVRVVALQTQSVDYLRHIGTFTTGDEEVDRGAANEMQERLWTIVEMVKHFNEGSQVRIIVSADTKVIYDLISEHLNNWKAEINLAYSSNHAPTQELLIFDRFANAIYEHAKWHFAKDVHESALLNSIRGLKRMSRKDFIPKPEVVTINEIGQEPASDDPHPPRPSMAGIFSNGPGRPTGPNKSNSLGSSISWK